MANPKRQRQDSLRADKIARLEAEKQATVRKKNNIRYGGIAAVLIAVVVGVTLLTSRGDDKTKAPTAAGAAPQIVIPAGAAPKELKSKDIRIGTGETVKAGDTVQVRYTGVAWSTKKQFDSNWGDGKELFPVANVGTDGAQVIKGWKNIVGMKVGGRRELTIPPALGYGDSGAGADIKAGETLVFVVDVVATARGTK